MNRKQVCIIHGGTTFANNQDFIDYLENIEIDYDRLLPGNPGWKKWLVDQLPDYDVLLPQMPNKQNADYRDWATYFSKIIPLLDSSCVLIGHSLGGIFLSKFLTQNPPKTPYNKLILVAAPFDDETSESLGNFNLKNEDISTLSSSADNIHIFASLDDPVVPSSEVEKYKSALLDEINVHLLSDRGHFNTETFPEILTTIQQ